MERSTLLSILPPEIWHYYIYRIEHQLIFQDVVQDLRERVCWVDVDEKSRTFLIANEINSYSVLAVF